MVLGPQGPGRIGRRLAGFTQFSLRGHGGTGRRARFRFLWGQPCGGSSPLDRTIFSDNVAEVTPVPIPNTEVKLCRADGTWTAGSWESRTSLGERERLDLVGSGLFFIFDEYIGTVPRSQRSGEPPER